MAETVQSIEGLSALKPASSESEAQPKYVQKLDKQGRAYATGKRKNAVARVWIKPGSGKIIVNTRPVEVFFARPVLRMMIQQPLVTANRQRPIRRRLHGVGRRIVGPGGRGASRHLQGVDLFRAGTAHAAQARRLPHPRSARGRAQEIRPHESASFVPVLEALRRNILYEMRKGPVWGPFSCVLVAVILQAFLVKMPVPEETSQKEAFASVVKRDRRDGGRVCVRQNAARHPDAVRRFHVHHRPSRIVSPVSVDPGSQRPCAWLVGRGLSDRRIRGRALDGGPTLSVAWPDDVAPALLFICCGMIWSGARKFHGRDVLPLAVVHRRVRLAACNLSAGSGAPVIRRASC